MKKRKKVDRDSILGEVVIAYPDAGRIMLEYGLHCFGCAVRAFETVEQGARAHGLSDEEIEEMINKINKPPAARPGVDWQEG